ncbi:SGNH/GDSL hydrolase family protein [Ferruginibacter sp.]
MKRIGSIIILSCSIYVLMACKKKHEEVTSNPPVSGYYKTYLALGDSYTIGQSVTEQERFPAQAVKLLQQYNIAVNTPEYIAVTGWTTRNLLDAIKINTPPTRSSYDFVTLLIGVNNQFQGRSQAEYTAEFNELLNAAVQLAGNDPKKVAVLSIPDWGVTPFATNYGYDKALIAKQIDSFNVINKQATLAKNVAYIDITPLTRMAATDPSLVAADGLHPSGKAYAQWAALLAPVMKASL